METHLYNSQSFKERRKELRKNQTETEKILWSRIKNKQIDAYKFFRQYSVGSYILDFYCPDKKLAIELDGAQHLDNKEYDQERDNYLLALDIKTVRFWNSEINANIKKQNPVLKRRGFCFR